MEKEDLPGPSREPPREVGLKRGRSRDPLVPEKGDGESTAREVRIKVRRVEEEDVAAVEKSSAGKESRRLSLGEDLTIDISGCGAEDAFEDCERLTAQYTAAEAEILERLEIEQRAKGRGMSSAAQTTVRTALEKMRMHFGAAMVLAAAPAMTARCEVCARGGVREDVNEVAQETLSIVKGLAERIDDLENEMKAVKEEARRGVEEVRSLQSDQGLSSKIDGLERECRNALRTVAEREDDEAAHEGEHSWATVVRRRNRGQVKESHRMLVRVPEGQQGEDAGRIVKDVIKPRDVQIKVTSMRARRDGGVIVEVKDKNSANAVRDHPGLKERGLLISEVEGGWPKIRIYGVDAELDEENLREALVKQNLDGCRDVTPEVIERSLGKLIKLRSRSDRRSDWLVECRGPVFRVLVERGKAFIDWYACGLKEYIDITRCYKCSELGHTAKRCGSKVMVCRRCGGEHDMYKCSAPESSLHCRGCKERGWRHDHLMASETCEIWKRAKARYVDRTEYGQ
jgi:hypothetical protein